MGEKPIGVDLFAGAGGLSLGFEQAGFEILAAVEYDPIHAATHEYNLLAMSAIRHGTWLVQLISINFPLGHA